MRTRPLDLLHRALRRAGLDLVRYRPLRFPELRRARILAHRGIDLVLDVGANDGAWAADLRAQGYRGRIVSFEPQAAAFAALERRAATDPAWEARRLALGAAPAADATLHLAGNSSSSSLLPIAERHVAAAPESRTVGTERVEVETLDGLRGELLSGGESAFLKLDVQGYELEVLRGAADLLGELALLEVELSLVPLYDGAPEFTDVLGHVQERELRLLDVEPVLLDPADGSVLQLNALFGRDR